MRRGVLALLLVALLVPSASAGSARRPEITDDADMRDPAKDILSVWFEEAPGGVRFTIEVASLEAPRASHLYTVGFRAGGRGAETVAIGFDGARSLRSGVDTPNAWTPPSGGRARGLDDALLDEAFTPGTPAYLSATIPEGRFGLDDGVALTSLSATSVFFDEGAQRWITNADVATSAETFVVGARGSVFPILVPAWVLPTIVLACTSIGLASGWGLARATRRAPQAAPPVHVPVKMLPPPGSRFQRAPPPKR
ncbi:MAG TPA: hypothetical protein VM370_02250 [Candidatus Thermoplasmatota archaeon]|nr:hypothetical protein [Candidatus Thermoplasmatota archaeon]